MKYEDLIVASGVTLSDGIRHVWMDDCSRPASTVGPSEKMLLKKREKTGIEELKNWLCI